jgi:FkbM family methyltransferase
VFRSYVKQLKEIHGDSISSQVYQTVIVGIFSVAVRIALKKELTLNSILALHMQEFPISILLMKEKGRLFIDIGANRGYYALLLRNNFDRIVCFEPAASFDDLITNIAAFRAESKIRAEKIAISNSDGNAVLHLALYSQFNASVAAEQLVANSEVARYGEGQLLGTETVKKTTLAKYFKNEQFIDLIKVDVGGSEWEVLEGAIPIIDRIGAWVVELYSADRLEEMREWFAHYRYRTRLLSHGAKTCHIIASRHE